MKFQHFSTQHVGIKFLNKEYFKIYSRNLSFRKVSMTAWYFNGTLDYETFFNGNLNYEIKIFGKHFYALYFYS